VKGESEGPTETGTQWNNSGAEGGNRLGDEVKRTLVETVQMSLLGGGRDSKRRQWFPFFLVGFSTHANKGFH